MASPSPVGLLELFQLFPDQGSARLYLEEKRWGGKRLGFYRCRDCGQEFTVRTKTIFERSHVPLHKWFYSRVHARHSSQGDFLTALAKEIGVQQKTAWFMLGRLNEGSVKHHTLSRLGALALKAFCHRITCQELTYAPLPCFA